MGKSTKSLTFCGRIAIVRRFREYPDRVVGEARRTDGWRKTHVILGSPPVAKRVENDCVILDTRDSPQDIPDLCFARFIGSECRSSAAYRNRACDTLHPGWAMRAGTAKRSRLILEIEGKTLGHRRLFTSGLLYRFTDAAGKIFVRDASAFSLFCVYGVCTAKGEAQYYLRVSHKFGCNVSRALTRSSSAYVPSARQAGPHAHSL
ncbi:hypothetical protein HDF12_003764 [Edaphobacter lichenicola]|uniref:Uncharacterized protein n=2 Tax=Tunturiibacter TaxID=3154218 RepID=A0A7Y9NPV7_9BACT|nr:hypothetical protein [Edaphobacter lichenicola]NYF53365.1 hypothetical protein [Edaphobacter lichenicola]